MGSIVDLMTQMVERIRDLQTQALFSSVVLWLALALVTGGLAAGKGRSAGGYFLLALVLSPAVGLITILVQSDLKAAAIADLRARLARMEGVSSVPIASDEPMIPGPVARPQRLDGFVIAMIIALILLAIIGGVSQLGQSANMTFNAVEAAM